MSAPNQAELEKFWELYKNKSDDIILFNVIDDLIMAAYNHVKQTGYKVIEFEDMRNLLTGFKTEDGKYFMGRAFPMKAGRHVLYSQIKQSNVNVVDFVNTQLIAFL